MHFNIDITVMESAKSIALLLTIITFNSLICIGQTIYDIGGKKISFKIPNGYVDGLKKSEKIKQVASTYTNTKNITYAFIIKEKDLDDILNEETVDVDEYFKIYTVKEIANEDIDIDYYNELANDLSKKDFNGLKDSLWVKKRLEQIRESHKKTNNGESFELKDLNFFEWDEISKISCVLYNVTVVQYEGETDKGIYTKKVISSIVAKYINQRIVLVYHYKKVSDFDKDFEYVKRMSLVLSNSLN